jgi:hypothetical protein
MSGLFHNLMTGSLLVLLRLVLPTHHAIMLLQGAGAATGFAAASPLTRLLAPLLLKVPRRCSMVSHSCNCGPITQQLLAPHLLHCKHRTT